MKDLLSSVAKLLRIHLYFPLIATVGHEILVLRAFKPGGKVLINLIDAAFVETNKKLPRYTLCNCSPRSSSKHVTVPTV